MNLQQLLSSITPDIYQNLRRAVELGKWPDGNLLTSEQKALCMQAVIAYEYKNLPPDQHTGFIPPKAHSHCGGEGEVAGKDDEPKPLKWS
jgi:hypothetical protein